MDDITEPRRIPTVRLKPRAEARAIRHGFPWVYADELVTDRRTHSFRFVVLADGIDPKAASAEINSFASARLSPSARPAQYIFRDALPTTPTGKVQKHLLVQALSS